MSKPNSLPDDELLSAYLDGELAGDQRAALEERLESDATARQMLEELRQLSAAVRALPAETLGDDLRQRVLERVAVATKTTSIAPRDDSAGWRRGIVWASMAVAAMLLLMVFRGDQTEDKRQVAAVDRQANKKTRTSESGELRAPAEEIMSTEAPAIQAAQAPSAPAEAAGAIAGDTAVLAGASRQVGTTTIELTVPSTGEKELPVQQAFGKLLAQHDVTMSTQPLAFSRSGRRMIPNAGKSSDARKADNSEPSTEERGATVAREARTRIAAPTPLEDKTLSESIASQANEVAVLVEATPEQIRSILATCRAAPELFAQVDRLSQLAEAPKLQSSTTLYSGVEQESNATGSDVNGRAWVLERPASEAAGRGGALGGEGAMFTPAQGGLGRSQDSDAAGGPALSDQEVESSGRVRVLFLLRREQ